jgi:hypothetical protein
MKSNLSIRSNLMIDDEAHKPEYKYLPGDYVGQIYPETVDSRVIHTKLSNQQLIEYKQYLECLICRMPCAGTCKTPGK